MRPVTFKSASIQSRQATQRGQGMTEYIIIVALIAVAAIGVNQFFGEAIRHQMAGIATEISGKDASDLESKSQAAAGKAGTAAGQSKGLANYDNNDSIGK